MFNKNETDSKSDKPKSSSPSGKTPKQGRLSKTLKLLSGIGKRTKYLLAFGVALLLIGGVALYFIRSEGPPQMPQEIVTPETTYEGTDLTYTEKAQQMVYTGEYDGAQWLLQDGADHTGNNNAARAEFYVQKVQLALEAEKYDDALDYALKADKAEPTALTAVTVAISAELSGDKATAVEYYQLAADRTPEDQRQSELSEYGYYLNKAKQLGESQ